MGDSVVTIDYLGGLGDGVASTPAGRLHIPLTAPGDHARVAVTGKDSARLVELLDPGPARVEPPCAHFGRCGGCALQHLAPEFIADWKRQRVVWALDRAGLDGGIAGETISIPPATRRRATLAAKRAHGFVVLGFAERASHFLVDLAECWVLRPELARLIAPLRDRLAAVLNDTESADVALTLTDTGIDLVVIRPRALTLADREALAQIAEDLDLARISWRPAITRPAEPVAGRRSPAVQFGARTVALPPGGFLQPSLEGEALLTRLVLRTLHGVAGPIVDLFSGLGTFALPASALGPVTAFDADPESIAALAASSRGTRVAAHRRDLFREPVTVHELNGFAAAIIDPPRAGAQAQARMLARSTIPVIASVACNPISFARDAAILAGAGYQLEQVTPIDQFPWSPHVELVGCFRRDNPSRSRPGVQEPSVGRSSSTGAADRSRPS